MALVSKRTTRSFYKRTYSGTGALETITILVRGDDQDEGTVRAVKVFNARHSMIYKSGSPIQKEMAIDAKTTWHLPTVELLKAGINYVNVLTRIVDRGGEYWQPETENIITIKTFRNHVCVDCVRVDPPNPED